MDLKLLNITTGIFSQTVVPVKDEIFSKKFNEDLVFQVVNAYRAYAHQGSKAQKTRSEVRGGGAKPWRQKGTGRARSGTIRSPLWRGGGVTFAAKPRDFSQKVNKKMYRSAMCAILSELIRQDRMILVENFVALTCKTRDLVKKLHELKLSNVLIVTNDIESDLYLATRNLPMVEVCNAMTINPVNLISFEKIVITIPALRKIEERLA